MTTPKLASQPQDAATPPAQRAPARKRGSVVNRIARQFGGPSGPIGHLVTWQLARGNASFNRWLVRELAAVVPPPATAIELGCGPGIALRELLTAYPTAPGTSAAAFTAGRGGLPRSHEGRDSAGGPASRDFPAKMQQKIRRPDGARRPNGAPAYYLVRPARLWITALRPRRGRTASPHLRPAVTDGGNGHSPGTAARQPAPDAAGNVPPALIASRAAAGDPNSVQGTTT